MKAQGKTINQERDLSSVEPLRLLANEMIRSRTSKGLSVVRLANDIGLNIRSISRIEQCKRFPTIQTLSKIAEFLGKEDEALINRWLDYRREAQKEISRNGGVNSYPLMRP